MVSHIPTSGHRESLTTEVRITHFQTGNKRDSLITTTTTTTQAWVSAEVKETQTDLLVKGMDKVRIVSYFFHVCIYFVFLWRRFVFWFCFTGLLWVFLQKNSGQIQAKVHYGNRYQIDSI